MELSIWDRGCEAWTVERVMPAAKQPRNLPSFTTALSRDIVLRTSRGSGLFRRFGDLTVTLRPVLLPVVMVVGLWDGRRWAHHGARSGRWT